MPSDLNSVYSNVTSCPISAKWLREEVGVYFSDQYTKRRSAYNKLSSNALSDAEKKMRIAFEIVEAGRQQYLDLKGKKNIPDSEIYTIAVDFYKKLKELQAITANDHSLEHLTAGKCYTALESKLADWNKWTEHLLATLETEVDALRVAVADALSSSAECIELKSDFDSAELVISESLRSNFSQIKTIQNGLKDDYEIVSNEMPKMRDESAFSIADRPCALTQHIILVQNIAKNIPDQNVQTQIASMYTAMGNITEGVTEWSKVLLLTFRDNMAQFSEDVEAALDTMQDINTLQNELKVSKAVQAQIESIENDINSQRRVLDKLQNESLQTLFDQSMEKLEPLTSGDKRTLLEGKIAALQESTLENIPTIIPDAVIDGFPRWPIALTQYIKKVEEKVQEMETIGERLNTTLESVMAMADEQDATDDVNDSESISTLPLDTANQDNEGHVGEGSDNTSENLDDHTVQPRATDTNEGTMSQYETSQDPFDALSDYVDDVRAMHKYKTHSSAVSFRKVSEMKNAELKALAMENAPENTTPNHLPSYEEVVAVGKKEQYDVTAPVNDSTSALHHNNDAAAESVSVAGETQEVDDHLSNSRHETASHSKVSAQQSEQAHEMRTQLVGSTSEVNSILSEKQSQPHRRHRRSRRHGADHVSRRSSYQSTNPAVVDASAELQSQSALKPGLFRRFKTHCKESWETANRDAQLAADKKAQLAAKEAHERAKTHARRVSNDSNKENNMAFTFFGPNNDPEIRRVQPNNLETQERGRSHSERQPMTDRTAQDRHRSNREHRDKSRHHRRRDQSVYTTSHHNEDQRRSRHGEHDDAQTHYRGKSRIRHEEKRTFLRYQPS